jgi:DNA repair protein SbcC/Rad50
MRVERVVAHAFGPFQGETLELAPGMSVVAGPNEAGKSSWHAALRLALTGVRRGRGRTTSADLAVAERHRPWDLPERWEVEARVSLDDGRRIDIHQDLAGKVACRAVDVALGRDVSDEILDGTPDASRWLGLDRDAFAATVSVSQAEILAVADAADQLQEQMQRAAATRGTDATAAQAIERLVEFRREAVGADTVAAKGPLRMARRRLDEATADLDRARSLHLGYLEHAARAEEAERRAVAARGELALAEAARATAEATRAGALAERATLLSSRYPAAPPGLAERDARADAVAAAVEGWEHRPEPMVLSGRSSEAIRAELAALPGPPAGETQPDPALAALFAELQRSEEAVSLLADPGGPATAADRDQVERIRSLARRIAAPEPAGARELEGALAEARQQAARRAGRRVGRATGWGGALLAIGGFLLVGAGLPPVGAALVALGLLAIAVGAGIIIWDDRAVRGRVLAAERALAPYRAAADRARVDREAAMAEARAAGWPERADALEALADRLVGEVRDAERAVETRARRDALVERAETAGEALRQALAARGVTGLSDLPSAWRRYVGECEARARQSVEADRSDSLRHELATREAAERSAAAVEQSIEKAERALRAAAADVGVPAADDAEALATALRDWQRHRSAALHENQVAIEEWRELAGLLDGRELSELVAEAERRAREARDRVGSLDPEAVRDLAAGGDLEATLAHRRARAAEADHEAHALQGALEAQRAMVPDVAEREEAVEAASVELGRVVALARTIDETLRLLREAQDRVHRDLAPILAGTVQRWLPKISAGAYTEVSVDPADLSVQVKERRSGAWRRARLLSAGTREQIYLLLRVAMAQHLVTTGETAPLLLDEVTAQADPERRLAMLRTLHSLAEERQVVLFSHDDAVAAWAEAELAEPRDRLVRLPGRDRAGAFVPGSSGRSADREPELAEATAIRLPA